MIKSEIVYLKIAITVVLIGYLLNSVGLKNIYDAIRGSNAVFFLSSCALIPFFIAVKTFKWHLMVRYSGGEEGFSTSLRAILVGLGFSIFTPMRAGEILRITYYKSVEKVMLGGLVVVDRLLDLLTVLYLSLYFIAGQFSLITTIIVFLIISALFSTLFALKSLTFRNRVAERKTKAEQFWEYVRKLKLCLDVLTPMNTVRLCGISFAIWILAIVQFYFIMNTYHGSAFKVALASLPIIQLSNLLPITIGGIGVRENLSVMVMEVYDIPKQFAALSAFTLYAIDILIPGIAGLILFGTSKKR